MVILDGHFGQPPVYNPQTKDGFHLTELTHPPSTKDVWLRHIYLNSK